MLLEIHEWKNYSCHLGIRTIDSLIYLCNKYLRPFIMNGLGKLYYIAFQFIIIFTHSCTDSSAQKIFTELWLYVRSREHKQRYSPNSQWFWGWFKFEKSLENLAKNEDFYLVPQETWLLSEWEVNQESILLSSSCRWFYCRWPRNQSLNSGLREVSIHKEIFKEAPKTHNQCQ